MIIDYNGQSKYVAGRLKYATPPEPGTILGPNQVGEHLVVLATDEATGESLIGYAGEPEVAAAMVRDPQSLTEFRVKARASA